MRTLAYQNSTKKLILFLLSITVSVDFYHTHSDKKKKESKFVSRCLMERILSGRGDCMLGVELLSRCGISI